MENRAFLNIETKNGLIMIPFLGLKELDCFTVGFDNLEDLITSLSKILDLSLDVLDVLNIYITGSRYKKTRNSSLFYVKYSCDNYNYESLRDMFSLYLKQDHRRIRKCDIRFVTTGGIDRFLDGGEITDQEIDLAVNAFLKKDYKKMRDVYFMIKDDVSIRTLKNDSTNIERSNISSLEAVEDSFVQNLIERASRGEDLDAIMEELSLVDLEDISSALSGSRRDIFDGLTDEETRDLENIYSLEMLTNMSIEDIKSIQTEYQIQPRGIK